MTQPRLGAGKAFALEIDLGLIPDLDPMIAQCLGDRDARPSVDSVNRRCALVLPRLLNRPGSAACIVRFGGVHAHRMMTWVIIL